MFRGAREGVKPIVDTATNGLRVPGMTRPLSAQESSPEGLNPVQRDFMRGLFGVLGREMPKGGASTEPVRDYMRGGMVTFEQMKKAVPGLTEEEYSQGRESWDQLPPLKQEEWGSFQVYLKSLKQDKRKKA